MDILIIAIEAGRWGPARLPQVLRQAGLTVAALCPADNVLAASTFLSQHLELPRTRSARKLARALASAIEETGPKMIIPADEQVVALLGWLLRNPAGVSPAMLALVRRSVGTPEQIETMLFKSNTIALARRLGVRTPAGETVHSADHAVSVARRIGYPVFVKHSFGWAGRGVTACRTENQVAAAMRQPNPIVACARRQARRALGRDWFPVATPVDVQGAVAGRPAMYCALAWEGRLIAGFAGIPLATRSATGPSTQVRLCAHAGMEQAVEALVAGLGCSGFIGFDFMLEETTGEPVLLECNPRPIQVCHLGVRVGVDLAAAFAAVLGGQTPAGAPARPTHEHEVVLFPHVGAGIERDVPWQDLGLRRFAAASMHA